MNFKSRIFLFGPPAAGKSTIALQLLSEFLYDFSYFNLDDDILILLKEKEKYIDNTISDDFIDKAVLRLLKRAFQHNKPLIELPHHDYLLVMEQQIQLNQSDIIIIINAPFDVLEYRNNNRVNNIPIDYIRRCCISTNLVIEYLKQHTTNPKWFLINSNDSDPIEISKSIFDFYKKQLKNNSLITSR